jgi:hypothetical protein
VTGNVGIGKAPSTFDLDVAGSSNFDGRVKIGATSFPTATSYELAVGGGVIAEEVLVQLEGAWADYVFADNYEFQLLTEVENFIAREKHLPGVISAKEVAENGLNPGAIQILQVHRFLEVVAASQVPRPSAATEALLATIRLRPTELLGRFVQSMDCQSLEQSGQLEAALELPALSPVVYFLRLQHAGGVQTAKLVKVE